MSHSCRKVSKSGVKVPCRVNYHVNISQCPRPHRRDQGQACTLLGLPPRMRMTRGLNLSTCRSKGSCVTIAPINARTVLALQEWLINGDSELTMEDRSRTLRRFEDKFIYLLTSIRYLTLTEMVPKKNR